MEKKPKDKHSKEPVRKNLTEKTSWRDDQKLRRYYYDDAHGYEIYRPEDNENMTDAFFSETKLPKTKK